MSFNHMRSGAAIDLTNPNPASLNIDDIAHNLAGIIRYSGATHGYSVAQHSCLLHDITVPLLLRDGWVISDLDEREISFAALMHDAHEAVIGDAINPVKAVVPEFEERLGKPWQKAVQQRFHISDRCMKVGMTFDGVIMINEMDRFFHQGAPAALRAKFGEGIPGVIINPWGATEAEAQFLLRFKRLFQEVGNA